MYKIIIVGLNILLSFVAIIQAQDKKFDFTGELVEKSQFFKMESRVITYTPAGLQQTVDVYEVFLQYNPQFTNLNAEKEWTCLSFNIKKSGSPQTNISSLKGYTYNYYPGIDKKGQVFGIEHKVFENLKDGSGIPLDLSQKYLIYNTFIDFHGFCNVFATPEDDGSGIQDIKSLGQKIIHSAAHSQPPTHLGKDILPGSFFKNGEITLELKGIGQINKRNCALLDFDSGKSSFKMILQPAAGVQAVTTGSSHYRGDIYKDLKSNWIQKVNFQEWVVSETIVTPGDIKQASVIERNAFLVNLEEEEFYELLNNIQ